jgi:hypothetical protein
VETEEICPGVERLTKCREVAEEVVEEDGRYGKR